MLWKSRVERCYHQDLVWPLGDNRKFLLFSVAAPAEKLYPNEFMTRAAANVISRRSYADGANISRGTSQFIICAKAITDEHAKVGSLVDISPG
jgi:hypothetical protein